MFIITDSEVSILPFQSLIVRREEGASFASSDGSHENDPSEKKKEKFNCTVQVSTFP